MVIKKNYLDIADLNLNSVLWLYNRSIVQLSGVRDCANIPALGLISGTFKDGLNRATSLNIYIYEVT